MAASTSRPGDSETASSHWSNHSGESPGMTKLYYHTSDQGKLDTAGELHLTGRGFVANIRIEPGPHGACREKSRKGCYSCCVHRWDHAMLFYFQQTLGS